MSARSCPSRGPRLRILEKFQREACHSNAIAWRRQRREGRPRWARWRRAERPDRKGPSAQPSARCRVRQEKRRRNDDAGADLRPGGPQALGQAPQEENNARSQVPEAGGGKRGNRFDSIANAEVRRAPDEIDGQKTKYDRSAIQLRPGARGGL